MKITYLLKGQDCANCAAKMERKDSAIDGVTAAHVNFLTTKMTLEGEEARMDELAKKAGVVTATSTSVPEPSRCCTSILPVAVADADIVKGFIGLYLIVK